MNIKLVRFKETNTETLSHIYIPDVNNNQQMYCILERVNLYKDNIPDNEKDNSCVPIGNYVCKKVHSGIVERCFEDVKLSDACCEGVDNYTLSLAKQGITFEITGVVKRQMVRFHPGNKWSDSHGCPLTGMNFTCAISEGIFKTTESKKAFLLIMKELYKVNSFNLEITERQ